MSRPSSKLWTCSHCLRRQTLRGARAASREGMITSRAAVRAFTRTSSPREDNKPPSPTRDQTKDAARTQVEEGAMSRRLAEMAEETMDTGSQSDRKLMQEVGFSDELKKQLEERIAQTAFAAQNQRAASEINMPSSAGKGTRDIAGAQPWTGSESLHDAALRMLDDSHKRLRSPYKPSAIPQKSLRPAPKQQMSAANRLASARDKTSIYAYSQQNEMDEAEREKWRKELKERFSPGARPMPTTLQGLTSLANERIEDAIARGQFKNIPRGKGTNVERDYNANSPFLDTTEYFMNKIIQKQEIVPPWIEKQQELVKMVASFRGRLRNDWRRHAARVIASTGGSVADQVRRAQGYALAEESINPRVKKTERLSSISSDGVLTTVTVEERIAAGVPLEQPPEPSQTSNPEEESPPGEQIQITVTEDAVAGDSKASDATQTPNGVSTSPTAEAATPTPASTARSDASNTAQPISSPSVLPTPFPFRDAAWERTELAYHTLAITELNSLTRSYNLMAPKIAQKPYYTLTRELNRCFADVAPTLADAIAERSRRPTVKVAIAPHKEGGVLERFGDGIGAERFRGHQGTIRDEGAGKGYGFREFWRDLFSSNGRKREAA